MLAIVVLQPCVDSFLKIRGTFKIAALQESPAQDAEEQFHLVQPRTVKRREMKHVLVTGVAEKLAPLSAGL